MAGGQYVERRTGAAGRCWQPQIAERNEKHHRHEQPVPQVNDPVHVWPTTSGFGPAFTARRCHAAGKNFSAVAHLLEGVNTPPRGNRRRCGDKRLPGREIHRRNDAVNTVEFFSTRTAHAAHVIPPIARPTWRGADDASSVTVADDT